MQFFVSYIKVASAVWFKVTTRDYKSFNLELFKVHAWKWEYPPVSFAMEKKDNDWVCELKNDRKMVEKLQKQIDKYLDLHNPRNN